MTTKYIVRQVGDVTIIDLSGRLSLAEEVSFALGSGIALHEAVRQMAKEGRKKILLNLAEVTYIDSSGLGQLVGTLTTARNQGADLKLLKPNNEALGLLKAINLTAVFNVHDDEATAVQSFSRAAAASG